MILFSNFDTQIKKKKVEEAFQNYGKENILCFEKSLLYWFVKIFFPFLQILLLDIFFVILFYYVFSSQYLLIIIVIIFVLSLPFYLRLIAKYIDYHMDFVIVTPETLIEYNQTGIFNKKIVTVNERNIKTITIDKTGILYSIFNNGNLIFFSEGDDVHGDITFSYLYRPEELRTQAAKIMNKD